jgi:hypothetical protein
MQFLRMLLGRKPRPRIHPMFPAIEVVRDALQSKRPDVHDAVFGRNLSVVEWHDRICELLGIEEVRGEEFGAFAKRVCEAVGHK